MPFVCEPVGLEFIERAPKRFEYTIDLDASADEVFDLFADPGSWPQWFPAILSATWTSPETACIGATRCVTLSALTFHEQFLVWDRGQRFTFCFTGASLPMFAAGVEDYRLESLSPSSCRFHYGVYVRPALPIRLVWPLVRASLDRTFQDAANGLQGFIENKK